MIKDVGDAYTISIEDRFKEVIVVHREKLTELIMYILVYLILIDFFVIKSIRNFQSVYSKDIAAKIMMGCSYFESDKDLVIFNIVLYSKKS